MQRTTWNCGDFLAIVGYAMKHDHQTRVYDSILGLLSSEENPTPLVRLNTVVPFQHTQVFAKLEWYNPFGAVKDRIAANMIRDAEERGHLASGKKLVEATSGNTGIALAMASSSVTGKTSSKTVLSITSGRKSGVQPWILCGAHS